MNNHDLKDRIMKIGEILNGNKVFLGETDNGFCYKDYEAFEKKEGICYIPEHGVNEKDEIEVSYTYDCLKELVLEYGYEGEDILKGIFDILDWQSPETLLNDLEIE